MQLQAKEATQLVGLTTGVVRKYLTGNPRLLVDADADERSGWRRFTHADLVRLSLVRRLTVEFQMAASAAISLVNSFFETIGQVTAEAYGLAQERGGWFGIDPLFVAVLDARPGSVDFRAFHSHGQLIDGMADMGRPALLINFGMLVRDATSLVPGMSQA